MNKPATPLPKGRQIPRSFYNEVVRQRDLLLAERAQLVAALHNVMAGFVGDRGAHNMLGTEAGKHADEARALLAKLGESA